MNALSQISTLGSAHWRALRPRQWTKNLIVFAAPLFAFSISWQSFLGSVLAFCLFCAASSSFYLINDINDVEADRQHPVKRHRPIAAGLVAVPMAIAMALALLGGALSIAWLNNAHLGLVITAYAMLQVAYNLKLKQTVIADILAIATGFVLRADAGAAVNRLQLSVWFLLCTAMLALFLGIEKRKAELRMAELKGGTTRKVLWRYSPSLLNRMESLVTSGAVLTYALWSSGPQVNGASTPWMLLTVPFVLYGLFRYQMLSDPELLERHQAGKDQSKSHDVGGRTERPEEVLLTDRPTLITVLCWVITTFGILWCKHQGLI
jgi:decaprenyl-phosphate phosphoribosyltransferase